LTAAQLLVDEVADQVTFRHALTRQAVYADLLGRERRRLHRTVAEILELQHRSSMAERVVGDLAYHFFEAQMWQKALAYSQRAGDQARIFGAPQAAAQHYTRALLAASHVSPAPRLQLHTARAAAYELMGNFSAASADYMAALALAEQQQDKRARWAAMLALGALHSEADYRQVGVYVMQALVTLLARSVTHLSSHAASIVSATGI
jgi:predicted ATPase